MAEVDLIIEAISKGFDKAAADLKKVGDESEGAGKQTEGATKKFGGLGSTITNLVGAGAILGLANQMVKFGKDAILAASSAAEMQSKFNIVFGDVGGKVTQQLQDFANATGASRFELMGMAATLGDTFKPMGYTADEAGKLSVQMVKLATDLSSFNNIPVAEALQRIQGGLIGNHENLLKFGVLINEASLKEELMRMGADNLTGAQLNQAKVQARLNILMAGTTDAQGDAVRTADGFANKSRALQSALGDLSVVIGTSLLPAATDTVTIFAQMATQLTTTAKAWGEYDTAVAQILDTNKQAAQSEEEIAAASLKAADSIKEIQSSATGVLFFSDQVDQARQSASDLVASLIDTSTATGTLDEKNAAVEASLKKVYGSAVEVKGGYVLLNGVQIESTQYLIALANAQNRAAAINSAWAAGLKASAGVLALVAEEIPRVSDAEAELSDKRAQAANLLTDEEAKLAAYHAEMVRGAQADAAADAAAQKNIQASRDRAAGQAALTEEIRKTSLAMVEAAAEARTGYFNAAVEASDQTGLFTVAIDNLGTHLISVGGRTKQQADDLGALQEQYDKAAGIVHDYQIGLKGLGMSEDERNAKIQEQLDAMGALQGAMQPLIDITGKLTEVNSTAVISQDYVKQAMYDAAVAAGVSADALAVMRVELGLATQEQAVTQLATANFGAALDVLAGQLKTGKISQAEYEEKVRLLTLSLIPAAQAQYDAAAAADANKAAQAPATDGMNNAALAAENLANKLNKLPTNIEIGVHTNYTESGQPPNVPGGNSPDSQKTGQQGAPGSGNAGANFMLPPTTTTPTRPGGNTPQGGNTFIFQGFTPTEIMNMIQKAFAGEASKIRGRAASGGTRGR